MIKKVIKSACSFLRRKSDEKILGNVPGIKKIGIMTSIEVMALVHAEPGLDLFPFHLYKGVVKGTVEFKGEIPLMKRMTALGCSYYQQTVFSNFIAETKEKYSKKGWISKEEISFLESLDYIVGTEDVPSIFIIAPAVSKSNDNIIAVAAVVASDPVLLVKINENEWIPVHSWDHSKTLIQKLASLN